ncbi:MAG: recombinase family protein [Gemmataceae bacterium]|nr:recombinase family protein [Gemmataceae bacterium]
MHVACYCRVSTRNQKNDAQEAEIGKWLVGNGHDPAKVQWFMDTETGKTLNRPAFNRLQEAVFAGTVKTIVVYKLDRISRRLRDGVDLLCDWIERGVRVVVVTQQIDLSGPVGRMVAAVLLGIAEIELEFRRERQAAGIAVAKKRGVYKGRVKGTRKANPDRARELQAKGLHAAEIATALGICERTVFRYLRPPS